jgi:recombination protein RecA
MEKTKKKENKDEETLEVVTEIRERFGEGSIMKLGDVKLVDIGAISTGSPSLDIALGIGGFPRGRIVEVYGTESSGKTTLALHAVANAQKSGGIAAFVDAEHALDPSYAKKIGVNTKNLLISQPDTGEQALEIVETLVRSNVIDIIVIDSVAALTPQAEIEGEMGDRHIGLQARLMSQALRKLTSVVAKTNVTVIFINQIRMKIGVMFGNPETTPGGNALKFYSSVRVEVRRSAKIKQGEQIVGNRVKAKVVKNKVAPPFQAAEFDIMYNQGISKEGDLLDLGVRCDVLKKSGAWFQFEDEKLGQGREASKKNLRENPKLYKKIFGEIKNKLKEEDTEK